MIALLPVNAGVETQSPGFADAANTETTGVLCVSHDLSYSVTREVSRRPGRALVGRPLAPMRRADSNARLGFGFDPAAKNTAARKGNCPHSV